MSFLNKQPWSDVKRMQDMPLVWIQVSIMKKIVDEGKCALIINQNIVLSLNSYSIIFKEHPY